MLKSWGMSNAETVPNARPLNKEAYTFMDVFMFMTEEDYAIVILWVAVIIYNLTAWMDRNPVFGSVFIWAMAGILEETLRERGYNKNLIINEAVIIGVHTVSMMTLGGYLIFE